MISGGEVVEVVNAADWHRVMAEKKDAGLTYLDFLAGMDRAWGVEVVVHLLDPSSKQACLLSTVVEDGCLDSITDVFMGAAWHERETAELFGITFVGHPDPRPLLTRSASVPSMLKTTPLPARVQTPWPGAEAGRRRASRPPGVLDSWEEG